MSQKKDRFFNFIILSIAFHLAVLIFLTVRVLFFPSEIQIHQQAVRIDVVALPDKNPTPPAPQAPSQEKKVVKTPEKPQPKKEVVKAKPKKPVIAKPVEKKKAPEVKKENVKDEQESALDRLKALQKMKDLEKQKEQAQKTQEFKGNAISTGSSLSGLEKLHHDSYLDQLEGHIRSHWNLPEWLASGNFNAKVLLMINKAGAIEKKLFVTKSGNELFDQHVMATLDKASPLPSPPSDLVDYYANKGVEIRFPE